MLNALTVDPQTAVLQTINSMALNIRSLLSTGSVDMVAVCDAIREYRSEFGRFLSAYPGVRIEGEGADWFYHVVHARIVEVHEESARTLETSEQIRRGVERALKMRELQNRSQDWFDKYAAWQKADGPELAAAREVHAKAKAELQTIPQPLRNGATFRSRVQELQSQMSRASQEINRLEKLECERRETIPTEMAQAGLDILGEIPNNGRARVAHQSPLGHLKGMRRAFVEICPVQNPAAAETIEALEAEMAARPAHYRGARGGPRASKALAASAKK